MFLFAFTTFAMIVQKDVINVHYAEKNMSLSSINIIVPSGNSTCVVGTHTHVPTADTRILDRGTAYQTDIGMCGDYNSVIGMNKENSIKKFFKDKDAVKHYPSEGEGTLSGVIVEANSETGLAKKISRLIIGGVLNK